GSTGAVWVTAAPETTDIKHLPDGGGESASGIAIVVTFEKTSGTENEVQVEKEANGQWIVKSISMDINNEEDAERLIKLLNYFPDKHRKVIKYGLRGIVNLATQIKLDSAIDQLEPVFASLKPRERVMDLHLAPGEDELASMSLTGFAASTLNELMEDINTDPDSISRDAANLLFRLTRKDAS